MPSFLTKADRRAKPMSNISCNRFILLFVICKKFDECETDAEDSCEDFDAKAYRSYK
jgi:hypothetical protein